MTNKSRLVDLSESQNDDVPNFSKYGQFQVDNSLNLSYPGTDIKLERISNYSFSYCRTDNEGKTTEKIISRPAGILDLEICPVLPMNLPARKTNDLMFLRFEKQIYVSRNSKIDVFAPFPIEIGVFVQESSGKDASILDCFTCEPMHSRFGLYGTPDNGNLCMYAKVPLEKQSESFVYALTKISIINDTDNGMLVGKIIFPVTQHKMYYVENTTEAHTDDLSMVIRDTGKKIAQIKRVEYMQSEQDWKIAPSICDIKGNDEFLMDRGID